MKSPRYGIALLLVAVLLAVAERLWEYSEEKADTEVDLPAVPASFSAAKRQLYSLYDDHRLTFYCGCAFNAERKVDLRGCGVKPRKNPKRAGRVEAEHVFPAYDFGRQRACWRESLCTDKKGKPFKGRRCCEAIDPVFRAAHNDLHNLFPAVGEVNGDRSNYRWGMIPGEKREYGGCNIEVDSGTRRAEPPETVMGDIARVYFYMEKTYGFSLSDQQRQLFTAWNRMDPPDAWELERNRRVQAIQGLDNPFIKHYPGGN